MADGPGWTWKVGGKQANAGDFTMQLAVHLNIALSAFKTKRASMGCQHIQEF
jgi:hypothetical protein